MEGMSIAALIAVNVWLLWLNGVFEVAYLEAMDECQKESTRHDIE